MTRGLTPILLFFLFVGCSSSNFIGRSGDAQSSQELSLSEFNNLVRGRSFRIRLRNGAEHEATEVLVSRDSTSFRNSRDESRLNISNDSVDQFTSLNHIAGAGDGFVLSVIPAVILGASWHDIGGGEHPGISVLSGVVIVAAGSAVGFMTGHRECYRFSEAKLDVRNSKGTTANTIFLQEDRTGIQPVNK